MINNVEKYHPYIYGVLGLTAFLLSIMQKVQGFSLKIGTATPMLLLPFIIVISCFLKEWIGFWFGLVFGISLDVFMADSRIFNTIAFILVGVCAGLLFHYFFNRNIKAVVIGGLIICLFYFLVKWIILTLFLGDASAFSVLFKYEIPSAIYSAIFVIPFFYFVKGLCKKYIIHNS